MADPQLRAFADHALQHLQGLASALRTGTEPTALLQGALADAPGRADEIAALKCAVDGLFERGQWPYALPLATRLFALAGTDASAAYRLGTCLQRMGRPAQALAAFSQCAVIEGAHPTPGPLLRIGECLAALGQQAQAVEAFDACVEAARANPEHHWLQDIAARKADALRGL